MGDRSNPPATEAVAPATEPATAEPTATTTTTAAVGAVIEADDELNDDDSAIGSDVGSSTASITSSIMRFREENGRTYHAFKDGSYLLPNDQREQERLDLQHHLFLLTFGNKLYLSPAGDKDQIPLKNVLDVGTGTGVWAIDFADEHPDASVVGIDLSPIQTQFVPPNLSFQVDDLEQPWNFDVNFDFIYARGMVGSFADYPRFFEQAFENLPPGGWLEMDDMGPLTCDDDTMPKETSLRRWVDLLIEGATLTGRRFDEPFKYREHMEKAGFVNITEKLYKWPSNHWPKDPKMKEIGMWTNENLKSGVEAWSIAIFTRVLGWSREQLDVLLTEVRKDMRNTKIHSYWPIVVVYGQKPGEKKTEE